MDALGLTGTEGNRMGIGWESDGLLMPRSDPAEYPVSQPMPKLTAIQQCSGEAEYTDGLSRFYYVLGNPNDSDSVHVIHTMLSLPRHSSAK